MAKKERNATVVLDTGGNHVIEVEVINGKSKVRFVAAGLWFDISSVCNQPYDKHTFRDKCESKVRQQLQWYCDSDEITHRRSCHILWPTSSSPLSSMLTSRMMAALVLWHQLRNLH